MTNEVAENTAVVEVPHGGGSEALLSVSTPLVILTWVTFLLLALVLYRLAWKPILKALDMREKSVRDALEAAEKARAEAAATEARIRQRLAESETEARAIVHEGRTAAEAAARTIRDRAQQEAHAMVEEARRDIASATEQARQALRVEAADLAVSLTTRVLGETLDEPRQRALIDRMLKES